MGKGDATGYFELFAPEMTYFDPTTNLLSYGGEAGQEKVVARWRR